MNTISKETQAAAMAETHDHSIPCAIPGFYFDLPCVEIFALMDRVEQERVDNGFAGLEAMVQGTVTEDIYMLGFEHAVDAIKMALNDIARQSEES